MNLIAKRFADIEAAAETVKKTKQSKYVSYLEQHTEEIDSNALLQWVVRAEALISTVCGTESAHYKHFIDANTVTMYTSNWSRFKRTHAVFAAVKEDFEAGYLISFRTLVQSEVFQTELDQATELLDTGYITPSAVIAGVVLETTLRELCDRNGIKQSSGINAMNSSLHNEKIYSPLWHKRITTLAQIRNDAAHGNSDKFKSEDVKGMISDVQRFITDHL